MIFSNSEFAILQYFFLGVNIDVCYNDIRKQKKVVT